MNKVRTLTLLFSHKMVSTETTLYKVQDRQGGVLFHTMQKQICKCEQIRSWCMLESCRPNLLEKRFH